MRIDHVHATVKTILRTNMDVVVLSIIYLLIVIFGGISVSKEAVMELKD